MHIRKDDQVEVIAGDDNGLRTRNQGRELVGRPRQAVVGARDDQRRYADRPDVAGGAGAGGALHGAQRREVVGVALREAAERAIDRCPSLRGRLTPCRCRSGQASMISSRN